MVSISPFSAIHHDWKVSWQTVCSNDIPNGYHSITGERERNVIEALSKVQVIGGLQLNRIFLNNNKRLLRKLVNSKRLIRHMIFRGSMEIPIYTLGSTGLTLAGQQEYTNMWHTTSESAVLRNILFYQLYGKFRDEDRTIEMDMAKEPYTGAITRKGKAFYILVVRNNREELTKFLSTYPKENIIVICEHIDHLQPFNEYLGGLNVRVTTDIDINKPFKDRFYKWHNNKWLKENTVTVN